MRARELICLTTVVGATGWGCGSSSSPALDAAGGAGGADAPVATGGTGGGGSGGTGGAAGSGGTGGSGGAAGTDAGSIFGCYTPGQTGADPCTKAERETLNNCYFSKCGAAFDACYGAGARMGSYGGACKGFIQCIATCGCGNLTCGLGCIPMYTTECMTCQANVESCQNSSGCVVPACAARPDGGAPGIPDGGFPGIPDGGFPGLFDGGFPGIPDGGFPGLFDGGFPGLFDGGTGGTCADLLMCCGAISDAAKKQACMMQYQFAMAVGDAACGLLYQGHKMAGDCP
jgi:hypothetical protein